MASYGGRNLRFGVREHAMGAIVNGLTLHGFRAFGGTFLTFSDYMRGAVRLSALMKLPSIWVYTHDSIGLGEDGPTHQPIEQLAGLRAMPRLNVIRPGRCERDRARLALRAAQQRGPDGVRAVAPEPADPRSGRDPRRRDRARRVRAARRRRRRSRADPDRHRLGGVAVPRGRRRARRSARPRRQHAVHGHLHGGRRGLPRAGAARLRAARGSRVEAASPFGWDKWIGPDGASSSGWRRSANPGRQRTSTSTSGSPPSDRVARASGGAASAVSMTVAVWNAMSVVRSGGDERYPGRKRQAHDLLQHERPGPSARLRSSR